MAREDKLKTIAQKGGKATRNQAEYLKFKDLNPHEVHRGNTTYRGMTVLDSPTTNRLLYAYAVRQNNPNARGFRLQRKTYKYTSPTGNAHTELV